jgi:hypothetical protein
MRLSLYRTDPPHHPDAAPVEPPPRKPPENVQLSEAERDALHSWAAKHGFVLRSAADEWLAEAAWRRDVEESRSA